MKKKVRITESDLHNIIKESVKRIIKEGESGGWVVDDSEAQEALQMFQKALGKDAANEAVIRAMSDHVLADILAYLFRQYDFREWDNRNQRIDNSDEYEEDY